MRIECSIDTYTDKCVDKCMHVRIDMCIVRRNRFDGSVAIRDN